MADLLVVRHARAAAPDDLRLPGIDLPLRPEGCQQAAALAERLAGFAPVAVWSGPARRGRETGAVVAARCGLAPEVRDDLRELDFGAWGGRTYAEVVATDPGAAAWFDDPAVGAPPGGESAGAAADRVLAALAELASLPGGPVVVVGHAGSLRLALARGLGVPLAAAWRLRLDCAGLTVLGWAANGPVVHRLNDTAHLDRPTPQEGAPRTPCRDGPGASPVIPASGATCCVLRAGGRLSVRTTSETAGIGIRAEASAAAAHRFADRRHGGGEPAEPGVAARLCTGGGDRGRPSTNRGHRRRRRRRSHDVTDATTTLVLGGARSGKSALAERLAAESGRPVLYLATAIPFDDEMAGRIAAHRADRPAHWRTVEAPSAIAAAVRAHARPGDLVLLDCLTVWLGNRLLAAIGPDRDPAAVADAEWAATERDALADIDLLLTDARARGIALILVSNEVGMGVVPAYPLGRRYRDTLGRLNQAVAALADAVLLTVAGLALDLRRLALAGSASAVASLADHGPGTAPPLAPPPPLPRPQVAPPRRAVRRRRRRR